MTITHEKYADLRKGDVVEYRRDEWPEGAVVRAPLEKGDFDNTLYVLSGMYGVRNDNGTPYEPTASLTVVSRAPRPLYVNHPRTEPRRGDVVRFDPDGDPEDNITWNFDGKEWRQLSNGTGAPICGEMPRGLTLLVDGETGIAVPS